VQWEDVSRGVSSTGALSCVGPNITDVRLRGKDNETYPTIRSENWNERIGKVSASQVAVISEDINNELTPTTLQKWLQHHNLYEASLDTEVSIRFQTVFLPNKTEFCVEHYNYQTRSKEDPKNLILLCTSQGSNLSQDVPGFNKLYKVKRDDDGELMNHWFEIEASAHKVGEEQKETDEERKDALSRGKATATVIGIKQMGTRFNVIISAQIPLKQRNIRSSNPLEWTLGQPKSSGSYMFHKNGMAHESATFSASSMSYGAVTNGASPVYRGGPSRSAGSTASAARVSHGTRVGHFKVPHLTDAKRHETEHITITVTMYYALDGDLSEETKDEACQDLEKLFEACYWSGRLADPEIKKAKLGHGDEVKNFDVFPS
jgi:huntingtin